MLHTYIHTDRHTDPLTKWIIEELSLLKRIMMNELFNGEGGRGRKPERFSVS